MLKKITKFAALIDNSIKSTKKLRNYEKDSNGNCGDDHNRNSFYRTGRIENWNGLRQI
jgi:hypothetical protein